MPSGTTDWHESAAPEYWYYYRQGDEKYPTTTGLSVQSVSDILIYSHSTARENRPARQRHPTAAVTDTGRNLTVYDRRFSCSLRFPWIYHAEEGMTMHSDSCLPSDGIKKTDDWDQAAPVYDSGDPALRACERCCMQHPPRHSMW